MAGFAQTLTVHPSAIPGVEIIGSQSPDYAAAVDRILLPPRAPALDAWLPYGIVLKNETAQSVYGVAVRWNLTEDGSHGTTVGRFIAPHRRTMAPGESALLLASIGDLRLPGDDTPLPVPFRLAPPPDFVARPDVNLTHYLRARGVEINLDGVVFASGQFVGPDTAKEYEEWVAETTVPSQVASKVLAMKAAGESTDSIVAWLRTASQPEATRDFTVRATRRTAGQLLRRYQLQGEPGLYKAAQVEAQPPTPQLYR